VQFDITWMLFLTQSISAKEFKSSIVFAIEKVAVALESGLRKSNKHAR
jgi:hypothetical protein